MPPPQLNVIFIERLSVEGFGATLLQHNSTFPQGVSKPFLMALLNAFTHASIHDETVTQSGSSD